MKRAVAALLLMAGRWSQAGAACPDHKVFEGILKANVDTNGFVDYDAIRINKGGDLYQYITFLESADLAQCSEKEQLAFWINAYNAHMIRLILADPQLKNISDNFKMFGDRFMVARHHLTLNEIEHRVLRSAAKNGGPIAGVSLPKEDPRIHFALANGAIDGPALSNHAYTGPLVDEQLQTAASNFANNPRHLRIENDKLVLCSLMKWYADDFKGLGGVGAYLASLTDVARRSDKKEVDAKLTAPDFPANVDFRYDWTLNSKANKPK